MDQGHHPQIQGVQDPTKINSKFLDGNKNDHYAILENDYAIQRRRENQGLWRFGGL